MIRRAGLTLLAALTIWLAIGFSAAQRACAHDPRFVCSPRTGSNSVVIPDVGKSWAYYGGLMAGQSDRFVFDVNGLTVVPWSLLVDARDANDPARPAATLYDADGRAIARLALLRGNAFYEPFSRESYRQSGTDDLHLSPGAYSIVVTMSAGSRQRYVMAIGDAERFSPFEIPYVAGAIVRIRSRRY